jgi:hypothetical protein
VIVRSRPPKRQHTVSRVVLRQFQRRNQITVFDRRNSIIHDKGLGGVFFYENFIAHEPDHSTFAISWVGDERRPRRSVIG